MKIKTLVEFSGVPKGTTGIAEIEKDRPFSKEKMWKITWDGISNYRGIPFKKRLLEDWFSDDEFKQYLEKI